MRIWVRARAKYTLEWVKWIFKCTQLIRRIQQTKQQSKSVRVPKVCTVHLYFVWMFALCGTEASGRVYAQVPIRVKSAIINMRVYLNVYGFCFWNTITNSHRDFRYSDDTLLLCCFVCCLLLFNCAHLNIHSIRSNVSRLVDIWMYTIK